MDDHHFGYKQKFIKNKPMIKISSILDQTHFIHYRGGGGKKGPNNLADSSFDHIKCNMAIKPIRYCQKKP
jgi:hypothetical protein